MKCTAFAFFSVLSVATAQRWKLNGCPSDKEDMIKGAIKDSIHIAKDALDVLNNNYNDEKVQSMVKHILGEDELDNKIKTAKEMLEGVSKYDEDDFPFLGMQAQNTDVQIFCDLSNWENTDKGPRNKAINAITDPDLWPVMQLCHDENAKAGDHEQMPMAITLSSDGVDAPAFKKKLDENTAAGLPPPRARDFAIPRVNKVNTMDLCNWFLKTVGTDEFAGIDDDSIAKVQQQSYIDGLKGKQKAIDALTGSLAATFLHEFTHTNLGGVSVDDPPGECYGWACVGELHDVYNADSINHLGVDMYLYKKGFWVDNEGKVQNI